MSQTPRLLLTAVAILGVGVSALTFVEKASGFFKGGLRAEATFDDLSLPPDFVRATDREAIRVKARRIIDSAAGSKLDNSLKELAARDIGTALATDFAAVSKFAAGQLGGFWNFRIRNTGSERVTSITLAVPWAARAAVIREGRAPTDTTVNGLVDLGDLQAGEELRATVWTQVYATGFDEEKIRLSHDAGRGTIFVMRRVGRFGQLANSLADPVAVLLTGLLTAGLVSLLFLTRGSSASGEKAPLQPPPS